jgi:hypothetical protein
MADRSAIVTHDHIIGRSLANQLRDEPDMFNPAVYEG